MREHIKYDLLYVSAMQDHEGCWSWDSWQTLESDIFIHRDHHTAKDLLTFLRRLGYLKKGIGLNRVYIDDDGYNLQICDKKTHEPILALCYGKHHEYNEL